MWARRASARWWLDYFFCHSEGALPRKDDRRISGERWEILPLHFVQGQNDRGEKVEFFDRLRMSGWGTK